MDKIKAFKKRTQTKKSPLSNYDYFSTCFHQSMLFRSNILKLQQLDLRTLTHPSFISLKQKYLIPNYVSGGDLFPFPFCVADTVDHVDDGIGTSDDETNSNSSTQSPETSESSSSPNMGQSRRVIKLDLAAISQLLAFDEVSRMMDRTVRRAAREKNKTSALFGFRKLFRPISTFFVKASLKSGRGTHFGKSSETANDRDSAHKTFRQKGRVVTQKGRWVHRPDLFFTAGQYLFSLRLRSSRELNLPKDDFHLRKKYLPLRCASSMDFHHSIVGRL